MKDQNINSQNEVLSSEIEKPIVVEEIKNEKEKINKNSSKKINKKVKNLIVLFSIFLLVLGVFIGLVFFDKLKLPFDLPFIKKSQATLEKESNEKEYKEKYFYSWINAETGKQELFDINGDLIKATDCFNISSMNVKTGFYYCFSDVKNSSQFYINHVEKNYNFGPFQNLKKINDNFKNLDFKMSSLNDDNIFDDGFEIVYDSKNAKPKVINKKGEVLLGFEDGIVTREGYFLKHFTRKNKSESEVRLYKIKIASNEVLFEKSTELNETDEKIKYNRVIKKDKFNSTEPLGVFISTSKVQQIGYDRYLATKDNEVHIMDEKGNSLEKIKGIDNFGFAIDYGNSMYEINYDSQIDKTSKYLIYNLQTKEIFKDFSWVQKCTNGFIFSREVEKNNVFYISKNGKENYFELEGKSNYCHQNSWKLKDDKDKIVNFEGDVYKKNGELKGVGDYSKFFFEIKDKTCKVMSHRFKVLIEFNSEDCVYNNFGIFNYDTTGNLIKVINPAGKEIKRKKEQANNDILAMYYSDYYTLLTLNTDKFDINNFKITKARLFKLSTNELIREDKGAKFTLGFNNTVLLGNIDKNENGKENITTVYNSKGQLVGDYENSNNNSKIDNSFEFFSKISDNKITVVKIDDAISKVFELKNYPGEKKLYDSIILNNKSYVIFKNGTFTEGKDLSKNFNSILDIETGTVSKLFVKEYTQGIKVPDFESVPLINYEKECLILLSEKAFEGCHNPNSKTKTSDDRILDN
jgi:hypothetical protein